MNTTYKGRRAKFDASGASKTVKPVISCIGIDPGEKGAIVITDGVRLVRFYRMPFTLVGEHRVDHEKVVGILKELKGEFNAPPVFLEKAVSFGMGAKGAFTYGRGYESLVIAIVRLGLTMNLVEPYRWAKVMHAGIDENLKPKVKSHMAAENLYPQLVGQLPRTGGRGANAGKLAEGPMDALLIAAYGIRLLEAESRASIGIDDDFY